MFAIYGIEGRSFRDTLENLRTVRAAPSSAKAGLSSNVAGDDRQLIGGAKSEENGVGFLSRRAVQAYRETRRLKQHEPICHAHQLMSDPVSCVPMQMGILDAHRYFHEQKFQQMPVLSARGQVVGMLSLKDLLQFIIIVDGQKRYVDGKCVADAMSREVIAADPVTDVRRVACVMHEYRLDAVPIIDDRDALVGILSRSDILRAVMNEPPLSMWS